MSSLPALRRSVWLLPIVVVVCAFMLLPAGAVVDGASASHASTASAAASSGYQSSAPAASANPSPFSNAGASAYAHTPSSTASSFATPSQSLPSALSLSNAHSASQFAQELQQKASASSSSEVTNSLDSLAANIASGKVSPSSVYLPNLNLLESGPHTVGESVGVGYVSNPAPMGIGDFGLGTTPYAYNTSHFEGSLTLNSLNGTYPSAYYFDTPPYATGGSYNSPYYVGIQLNTVTSNITAGGVNDSSYWTQNVITLNGNWIQFEDNVWNFTSGELLPGSILSGNGYYVEPTFYYDYGPAVPLTFPVTIDLYNNVSIVDHNDQVTFGYRVVDSAGAFTGIYDTVVFNNVWAPLDPANTPAFQVSGKYTTPLGLDYDSEIVFGGPGGGSNAVINQVNGTEQLLYSNQSSGGWKAVPSAYDFGADTGETAVGVGETWYAGGTVDLDSGPSLLYGLWNSQVTVRASSGSIHYAGSISPAWGWVLISDYSGTYYNTSYVPTTATGTFDTYLPPVNSFIPNGGSYVAFFTADNFTRTYVLFSTSNTAVSETLTACSDCLTDPVYVNGNAQAESAAATLSGWTSGPLKFQNLTLLNGLDGGFPDALFFDHLNDWGYVTFNMFEATGVTDVLNISDDYQGSSDLTYNLYFLDGPPIGSPPTLLDLAPADTYSLPNYGQLFAFYSDPHVQIFAQEVIGWFGGSPLDPSGYYNLDLQGGAVSLWNDPDTTVHVFVAYDGSYGVWAAASPDLVANVTYGFLGANGLSIVGSNDATVTNAYAIESVLWGNDEGVSEEIPFAIYDYDSTGGTFTNVLAAEGGVGFAGFYTSDAVVANVVSELYSYNITEGLFIYSYGVLLNGAFDTSITNVTVFYGAVGVGDGLYGSGSYGTTITDIYAYGGFNYAISYLLYYSDYTTIIDSYSTESYVAGFLGAAQNTTFENSWIVYDYWGLEGLYTANTTFDNTYTSENVEEGVWFEADYALTINGLNASYNTTYESGPGFLLEGSFDTTLENITGYGAVAVELEFGSVTSVTNVLGTYGIFDFAVNLYEDEGAGTTLTNITGAEASGGVEVEYWNDTSATDVVGTEDGIAVEFAGTTGDSATDVSASLYGLGVGVYESSDFTASDLAASSNGLAIDVEDSTDVTITTVSASDPSVGAVVDEGSYVTATKITATNESIGIALVDIEWAWVSDVTVSNMSVGVFSADSEWVSIEDVTATNSTLSSPWSGHAATGLSDLLGFPVYAAAAVVTEWNQLDSIADITATTYPAALYDFDSYDPGVTNVNATSSQYAIVLNDTYYGVFTDIGAYLDFVGMELNDDTGYVVITQSSFVDCTSYGIAIYDGYDNVVYLNNFIGNNGATDVYNSAHIQAYSGYGGDNYFDFEYIGNYWSDWHTYNQYGELAPYPIGDYTWDYYPLGGPEGTVAVYFYEGGLASGVTWSVTLNGVTQSTPNDWLVFYVFPGTYAFTVGAVSGYTVSPGSGTVTASGSSVSNDLYFTPVYTVTVTESGLPTGTSWTATVGGVSVTGTTAALSVTLGPGTYPYQISPVAGYNAAPGSGTLTVVNANYALAVTFTQVTYAVTITESGLASGTAWTVMVNGNTQSSTGTSITLSLPNGTYSVTVANVSGYSLSAGTFSLTVKGSAAGASVSFTPNTTTSNVSTDTFNTWFAIALALAVIALVLGLLALFLRRGKGGQQPPAAQPWTPPPAGAGGSAAAGGSDSGAWSEGPPNTGGSPPS